MVATAAVRSRTDREPCDPSSGVRCEIARTRQQREQAFHLVYENYLAKGLIEPNPCEMRVTPFHLLQTTQVFVATQGASVLCTVTLIGDGEMGLPMESIYPDEVLAARRQNLYVGEVSCLASRDIEFRDFLPLFVSLTRLMAQHARAHGMDQFLIATHPKHARFYQRFMAFEQIGPYREYPSVQNAPAVACCLDFARTDHSRPPQYEQFFGTVLPREMLVPKPMAEDEIAYWEPIVESTGGAMAIPI